MTDQLNTIPQVDIDRDKIKRAVKEALDDKAIEDLGKQNIALATQMSEGFAKINARLDTANGKLLRHDTQIELQKIDIADLKKGEEALNRRTTFWQRNQDKIIWGVIGTGLMLFYFILRNNGFPAFLN